MLTGNEGISFALIISVAAIVCTLYSTYANAKKMNESEHQKRLEWEKNFVKLETKLDDISLNMSDVMRKYEKSNEELQSINEKLINDNARLNDHERRISNLEHR